MPLTTALPTEAPLKPAYESLPGPVVAPPPPAPGLARKETAVDVYKWAVWLIPLALVVLTFAGVTLILRRRRARIARQEESITPIDESPPSQRQPASTHAPELQPLQTDGPRFWAPAHPVKTPDRDPVADIASNATVRPRIEVEIVAKRAGLNLLSATAEVEVILRNVGDAVADQVTLDVRLLNTSSAQDAQLGELFAAVMGKPVVPPFSVAAGEQRTVRAVAAMPRDAIEPFIAADRPMFVPMVAVDVRYDRGDGSRGQTAAAYAIGVLRDGTEKLAPFWLDGPARMFDLIAARPHSFAVSS